MVLKSRKYYINRLESIIEGTHVGTWEWNVQTGEMVFNEVWAQLIGYTLDELAPISIKTWETLAHPADLPQSAELLKRHFAGELPYYDYESRMKHKDGHWIWVQDRGRVITRTGDGRPLMMFGTHADITERKQIEQALRESEAQNRALISVIPDLIFTNRRDGEYLAVYASDPSMLFVPLETFLHRRVEEVLPKPIADQFMKGFANALDSDVLHELNYSLPLDGQERHFEARVVPCTEDTVVTIVRDITERQRAEEALRVNQRQLADIITFLPDATLAVDQEKRIILWNKAIEKMTGIPAAEMIGTGDYAYAIPFYGEARPILIDLLFEDQAKIAARYSNVTREGDTLTAESFCNALYDNQGARVFTKASPLYDPSGNVIGAIESIRDITERQRAEDELRRALAKEHQLVELKAQFIAMASHDFRTPLTSILTSANLLEDYSARLSDEKKLTYLQQIQASVRHMTQLLDDVLIIGHSDAGKLACVPAPIDLVAFSRALLDELRRTATPQHILTFEHAGDFAGARLDEKLLRQMLNNLLSNAIKYSPAGGPIRLSLRRERATVIITVADHGLGMPPEAQLHLYESFYRAQNTGGIPGTGLGLPIVKRAVDAHHGTIEVASAVGAGTTFTLTLPLQPPTPEELL